MVAKKKALKDKARLDSNRQGNAHDHLNVAKKSKKMESKNVLSSSMQMTKNGF